MMLFWGLAGVMLAVALLFTLPGLLRTRTAPETDLDGVNTAVIREQLAELEADLENGRLDAAQYRAAREDLERELLADLSAAEPREQNVSARSGRWAVVPLLVLIPVLTLTLYYSLGTRQIIPLLEEGGAQQVDAGATPDAARFSDMVEALAARLREEPDNAEGWVMLGRSYKVLERFEDAALAYARAHQLVGDDAGLMTDYVDTLVMANQGRFSEQAGTLLQKALEIQPDSLKALWLAGHWKFRERDYAGAVSYWQRAAAQLPAGSEDAQVIAQQIHEAQRLAGVEGEAPVKDTRDARQSEANKGVDAAAQSDDAQQAEGDKAITVLVSLDPKMADEVNPADTVYIFARAVQGPRMPLAVVRTLVGNLPKTVILDDTTAMAPAMKLSNFNTVSVSARITKSGGALPQSGDLLGSVSRVDTDTMKPVTLVIDRRVP